MATLEELVVQLTAETSGLRAELGNAVKSTQQNFGKIEDALKDLSDSSEKHLGFFEQAVATMAGFVGGELVTKAFETLKEAAAFAFEQLAEGVKEAAEVEQAFTRVANALAITGNYSKEAINDLGAFGETMERVAGVEKTATASSLALLGTLTKLGPDGLKEATTAAIDLSAALGTDLQSATMLIAKGIEGNTAAFKRYGITVKEGGSESENFANIMKAVSGIAGGAGAGAMNTYQGAVKLLGIAYRDLFETLGKVVVQNPVIIAMVKAVVDVMDGLTRTAGEGTQALKEGLANALLFAVELMKQLVDITGAVIDHFNILVAGVKGVILGIAAAGDSINYLLDKFGLVKDEDPFKATKASFDSLAKTVNSGPALKGLSDSLGNIRDAGIRAFGDIANSGNVAQASVKNNENATRALTAAEKARQEQLKEFAKGLADQAKAADFYYNAEQESLKQAFEVQKADETNYQTWRADLWAGDYATRLSAEEDYQLTRAALLAQYQEEENAMLEQARAQGLINTQTYNEAKTALETKHAADTKKANADLVKAQQDAEKVRFENFKSTLGSISTLSESSNKELAAIGKAAAISQATIDGFVAVQKALASAPPPFNFALAALVGTATAANVAKIAGVGFNRGVTSVPGVGNSDTVPAVLTPGERVVTAEQNRDLSAYLDRANAGGGSGGPNITINMSGVFPADRAEFGAMVMEALNDAIARGATVGLLGAK